MSCLGDAQVYGFVAGELGADALATVDEHLDGCAVCRRLVNTARRALASGGAVAVAAGGSHSHSLDLPAGSTVGRYEIASEIGRGAMGVVYAATDPKLSRTVALKLLRADRPDDGASLLDEARAMAQLAHPNVVAVYEADEIGDGGGEVYVAMERVRGATLRQWLEGARSRRDIVELMLAAGRGLAAAHDAAICHRDFKPENVLVGDDGRPRVSDFGLARAGGVSVAGRVPVLQRTETSVGGTPAYMAPELFAGAPATARSDQYSYCVTLFEALTGQRPFAGDDLETLAESARSGVVSWPSKAQIPRGLRSVIERGLRPDPRQRWPNMRALMSAVRGTRGRRERVAGLLAGAVAIGAIVSVIVAFSGEDKDEPCRAAAQSLDAVWNPDAAASLEKALGKSTQLAEVTTARVESYAAEWRRMRTQSCVDTHEKKTQSAQLLDRRTLCLDRRLSELDATLAQLVAGGQKSAIHGPRRIAELTDLSGCADSEALLAAVAPPSDPQTRQQVAELQKAIDRALERDEAGEAEAAYEDALKIVDRARKLGYEPLVAETLQVLAATEQSLRKLDDAEAHLDEALVVASQAKDHARVANVSVGKLYFFGAIKQDFTSALALIEPARAAVLQAGGAPLSLGDLHLNAGVIYDLAGKRDQAEVELSKALELFREHEGSETPRVGNVLHNLAALAMDRGDRERSRELFEQTVALRERVLGKNHPEIGNTLLGLGALARRNNQLADARKYYTRAAQLFESAYGPEHAQLGAVFNNLAIVETVEGNHREAEAHHRKAMKIRIASYSDSHPLVAQSLGGLANVISSQGRHEEALKYAQDSLALREKAYPEGHPAVAIGLHNLAMVLSALERHDQAVEHRGRALDILLEAKLDPADLAEVRFAHAKDVWALGRKREARALAGLARDGYAGAGDSERLAEVESWLAER